MKRFWIVVLCLVVILSCGLAVACKAGGNNGNNNAPTPAQEQTEPEVPAEETRAATINAVYNAIEADPAFKNGGTFGFEVSEAHRDNYAARNSDGYYGAITLTSDVHGDFSIMFFATTQDAKAYNDGLIDKVHEVFGDHPVVYYAGSYNANLFRLIRATLDAQD